MSENKPIKCTCGLEFTKEEMVVHIDDSYFSGDAEHWIRKDSFFTEQELERYREHCRHTDDRSLEGLSKSESGPVRAELRAIVLAEAEIRELDI
jgi:hypothetical protein